MTTVGLVRDRLRTLPLRRARDPRTVHLTAVLAVKDAMRYLPGWFETNAAHLDSILVHDDGSTDGSAEFAAAQPKVVEVLHRDRARPQGWDERETRRAVYAAAQRLGLDWLVAIDADERAEDGFGERARRAIVGLERRQIRAAAIRRLEVWDRVDRIRCDDSWADRWQARLFRVRRDAVLDDRPLHGHWAPIDARVRGGFVPVDLIVYHLAMLDRVDRERRFARYERIDPDHVDQPRGYAHLVDESGLRTCAVPDGRGYRPMHVDPALAVVVLAVGCPSTLHEAVVSLQQQDPRPEICVVNSGGGDARTAIAPLGVRVIDVPDRLLPGAARNLGIANTRAPFVAFLADDCLALPGWVQARLDLHRSGAPAVASAVVSAQPRSAIARAAHVLSFGRRMPGVPPVRAARYGVSYSRDLLVRCGQFRADLRVGEDTDLHLRLGAPITWAPNIRTAHRDPVTARGLWHDQRKRGWNTTQARVSLFGRGSRDLLDQARGLPRDLVVAWQGTAPRDRAGLVASAGWIALGSIARLTGGVQFLRHSHRRTRAG